MFAIFRHETHWKISNGMDGKTIQHGRAWKDVTIINGLRNLWWLVLSKGWKSSCCVNRNTVDEENRWYCSHSKKYIYIYLCSVFCLEPNIFSLTLCLVFGSFWGTFFLKQFGNFFSSMERWCTKSYMEASGVDFTKSNVGCLFCLFSIRLCQMKQYHRL